MINAVIRQTKKLLLKDIHQRNDKNVYRTSYFFNYAKFRKNKWGYQRARWFKDFTFCRFDPTKVYVLSYDEYFTDNFNSVSFFIRKNLQNLTYKSMLRFVNNLRLFFYTTKNKKLRDRLVYRRTYQNPNIMDTYLDIFLLRMGGAKHIRTARHYVVKGAYDINGFVTKTLRFINPMDVVKFSQHNVIIHYQFAKYNKELSKYISKVMPYKTYFLSHFLKAVPVYRSFNLLNFLNKLLPNKRYFLRPMSKVLKFLTYYVTCKLNFKNINLRINVLNQLDLQLYKHYISYIRPKQVFKLNNFYNFGKHFNFYNSILFKKGSNVDYLLEYVENFEEPQMWLGFYKIFTSFTNIQNIHENFILHRGEKNFWQDLLPFTFTINWSSMELIYFNLPFRNQWHIYVSWFKLRRFLRYNR